MGKDDVKRSRVQGSPFRVTIFLSTLLEGQSYRIRFDIGFLKTNGIKLRGGATSLFDV
jgi:hypothetical protein